MRYFLFIIATLLSFALQAEEIAMADEMRANGKIYVVVAVLAVILIGLISYLVSIDRKLKKLENK
tara:strand:+ start:139 stop:333 length:195 start_codon:yes stop_codon:yes gene_type:complete